MKSPVSQCPALSHLEPFLEATTDTFHVPHPQKTLPGALNFRMTHIWSQVLVGPKGPGLSTLNANSNTALKL